MSSELLVADARSSQLLGLLATHAATLPSPPRPAPRALHICAAGANYRVWSNRQFSVQAVGTSPTLVLGVTTNLDMPSHHYSIGRLLTFCRKIDRGVFIHIDPRSSQILLFRDWTGSIPLYTAQSRHGCYFSTRLSLLLNSGFRPTDINVVQPGSALLLELQRQRSTKYVVHDLKPIRHPRSRRTLVRRVRSLLLKAIDCIQDREAVVLLSGGVDSTALAYLLRQKVTRLEAIVMAVRPTSRSDPPPDLTMARRAADWLGIPLREVLVSPQQLIRAVRTTVRLAETRRASIVDELAGMLSVAKYLKKRSIPRVFTGEGPDDIFGGLEFELRFTPLKRLRRRMLHNFAKELPLELAAQQKVFWDIAQVEVVHPFLYRPLVKLAMGLPPRTLIDPKRRMKLLFREAFVGDIPDEFLWREKAITRVATGTRRVLEASFGVHSSRYYRLYANWLSHCHRGSTHGT